MEIKTTKEIYHNSYKKYPKQKWVAAIEGFFVTEKDYEKNLYNRIKYYYTQGFRVRKPATHRNDIIYPQGMYRKEHIDNEILTLCHWILTKKEHSHNGKYTKNENT